MAVQRASSEYEHTECAEVSGEKCWFKITQRYEYSNPHGDELCLHGDELTGPSTSIAVAHRCALHAALGCRHPKLLESILQ